LLPQDPFLFYHNDVNELSPAIGGFEYINSREVGSLEWKWDKTSFIVFITDEMIPVFFAPLTDIFYLLQHGAPKSNNLREDVKGRLIETDYEDTFCHQVHMELLFSSGVSYRNSLVKLSVVPVTANNLVKY
jgi:hypothetical protein